MIISISVISSKISGPHSAFLLNESTFSFLTIQLTGVCYRCGLMNYILFQNV